MSNVIPNSIRRLPTFESSSDMKVKVVPMTVRLAKIWHRHVQPLIDDNYRLSSQQGTRPIRADVGWNWIRWRNVAGLHNITKALGGHGPALTMCIVVNTEGTGEFPIGMLATVPALKCTVFEENRDRGFGWFLSDAPRELYTKLGAPAAKMVALALLDCGIQATIQSGLDGAFLLHAAPEGGDKLLRFYTEKVRMERLPSNEPPFTPIFRRSKSNEYFYFDDVGATHFCSQFTVLR